MADYVYAWVGRVPGGMNLLKPFPFEHCMQLTRPHLAISISVSILRVPDMPVHLAPDVPIAVEALLADQVEKNLLPPGRRGDPL